MAPEVMEWVKVGGEIVTIVTALAGLLRHLNNGLLAHLSAHFPSKTDFEALHGRIDELSERIDTLKPARRSRNVPGTQSRDIRPV